MKILGILGAGHLGQQIAHFATSDNHFDAVVFFDDVIQQKEVMGFPVIGKKDDILSAYKEKKFSHLLIGIGYNHLLARKNLFAELSEHIPMASLVHSSAIVDKTAYIAPGSVIYPGCIIDQRVQIGENTLLNLGCTISHDSHIGSHSFLAPRVTLAGFVTTGQMNMLGINTTIIDNIQLADEVKTGGGTLVIRNLEQSGLYVGSPAKFVR